MSRTLSMNWGSLDSLKVSTWCSLRPKVLQIRPTVDFDSPLSAAMDARDQCVASWGGALQGGGDGRFHVLGGNPPGSVGARLVGQAVQAGLQEAVDTDHQFANDDTVILRIGPENGKTVRVTYPGRSPGPECDVTGPGAPGLTDPGADVFLTREETWTSLCTFDVPRAGDYKVTWPSRARSRYALGDYGNGTAPERARKAGFAVACSRCPRPFSRSMLRAGVAWPGCT